MKTSELIGPALDWAVSITLGHRPEKDFHSHGMTWNGWWETAAYIDTKPNEYRRIPKYSTDWSQGGPIIERERITISALFAQINPPIPDFDKNEWGAYIPYGTTERGMGAGPTPLIAAMRSYVACKLGDEVEIPEEMK